MKSVSIPNYVPVGAVIGKGGSYCKALARNHEVRCLVDGTDRKVTLEGSLSCIASAEEKLIALFASFEFAKERVFEIAVRDGPTRWWSFRKDEEVSCDARIEQHLYRLQQSGRAVETAGVKEAWIKEFRGDDTANVMTYLVKTPSKSSPKIKLSFGKLCFKLKSIRCKSPTIAWPELQNLRIFEDFSTCWSNVCRRTAPFNVALMDDLEEWMEKGIEARKMLSVHIADSEGKFLDLMYRLVDGHWELHNAYQDRYVCGTYDVILNNDISFRLRAVSREKVSTSALSDVVRHLDVSIGKYGGFFDTEVSLKGTAPTGMRIRSFDVKSKVRVEANGLCFTIMYLDKEQEEFRLECRLSNEEKEKLDKTDNEAHVLLQKVLQMVS